MTHKEVWSTEDYEISWYKDTNTVQVRTFKGLDSVVLSKMMNILADIEIDIHPSDIELPIYVDTYGVGRWELKV